MAFETIVNPFNHAKLRKGNVFSHVCLFGGQVPLWTCSNVFIYDEPYPYPRLDLFKLVHLLHIHLLVNGRLTFD